MPRSRVLSALLVDDEPSASQRLASLLTRHDRITISGLAGSVTAARDLLATARPDVVFLDVEMPGHSGLELLDSIDDDTNVVFVTAHETYAVQAFAIGAVDYLVKPVDPERLAETIERLRDRLGTGDGRSAYRDRRFRQAEPRPAAPPPDMITVPLRTAGQSACIRIAEICWIESLRNFTRVALESPARLLVFRRRLADWLDELPEPTFARIGRSDVIRIEAIRRTEWKSRDETVVIFADGVAPLTLGRMAAMRLRECLARS